MRNFIVYALLISYCFCWGQEVVNKRGNNGIAIGLGIVSGDQGGISTNGEIYRDIISLGIKYNFLSTVMPSDIVKEYMGTVGFKISNGLYIKAGIGKATRNEERSNFSFDEEGNSTSLGNERSYLGGLSYFFKGRGYLGWAPELFYSSQTGFGLGVNLIL